VEFIGLNIDDVLKIFVKKATFIAAMLYTTIPSLSNYTAFCSS
jgi:hypothetical protein